MIARSQLNEIESKNEIIEEYLVIKKPKRPNTEKIKFQIIVYKK